MDNGYCKQRGQPALIQMWHLKCKSYFLNVVSKTLYDMKRFKKLQMSVNINILYCNKLKYDGYKR